MKYLLLVTLMGTVLPTYSQNHMNSKMNRNSDFESQMLAEHNDQKPPKKSSFSFWFFSSNDKDKKNNKSQHMGRRSRHMRIFDTHAIFDFDTEIEVAMANSKEKRETYLKESRLLNAQITFYEQELILLVNEHRSGMDKSQEILDVYTKLYELCYQSYEMMYVHTQEISGIFKNTYAEYDVKTREKIADSSTNPDVLVDELVTRYTTFLSETD